MRYFIENVKTYKSANRKGKDLQDFVTPLERYLVVNELSLDALSANIENHIEQLNRIYPRTEPLVLTVSRGRVYRVWTVQVLGNSDKIAAQIFITEVQGDINFSVQNGEAAEIEPGTDAQSGSKARTM